MDSVSFAESFYRRGFVIHRSSPSRWSLPGTLLAVMVAAGLLWPVHQSPGIHPDSIDYIQNVGSRPFVYPLLLDLLGHGYALCVFQCLLSIMAFAFCGYQLARFPGALIFLLPPLSLTLGQYHLLVLTESVSVSLLMILLGLTFRIYERWSWAAAGLWVLIAVLFSFTRVANAFLVPLVSLLPFLRFPRQACALLLAGCLILVVSQRSPGDEKKEFKMMVMAQLFGLRVLPDPQGKQEAIDAGLVWSDTIDATIESKWTLAMYNPDRKLQIIADTFANPSYLAWLQENGSSFYYQWVLTRPRSYAEAIQGLHHGLTWHWYRAENQVTRGVQPSVEWRYQLLGNVPVLLIFLPLLIPLFLLRRYRPQQLPVFWGGIGFLVCFVYAQSFLSLHGHPGDINRYLLPAATLARLIPLLTLLGIVQTGVRLIIRRTTSAPT